MQGPDQVHRHNAGLLRDFIVRSIEPHHHRWFFPGRLGRLTLCFRSTSTLESLNNTIKCKSSMTVKPSMSLLSSYLTQNKQVELRMNEHNVFAQQDLCSRGLWGKSQTLDHVTTIAESLNQQQFELSKIEIRSLPNEEREDLSYVMSKAYAVRVTSSNTIQLRKLSTDSSCTGFATNSPIPKWNRIRTLKAISNANNLLELQCSCPFRSSTGIPCRHVRCVFPNIRKEYVHVRWHKRYVAEYGNGNQAMDAFYNKSRDDFRLLLTSNDYKDVLTNAKSVQRYQEDENMVPYDFFDQAIASPALGSLLQISQEVHIPQDKQMRLDDVHSMLNTPPFSSNTYLDLLSVIKIVAPMAETDKQSSR